MDPFRTIAEAKKQDNLEDLEYEFKVERDGKKIDAVFKIDSESLYFKVFRGLASFTSIAVKERDGNLLGHGVRNFKKVQKMQKYLIDNKVKKIDEDMISKLFKKFEIVTYDY